MESAMVMASSSRCCCAVIDGSFLPQRQTSRLPSSWPLFAVRSSVGKKPTARFAREGISASCCLLTCTSSASFERHQRFYMRTCSRFGTSGIRDDGRGQGKVTGCANRNLGWTVGAGFGDFSERNLLARHCDGNLPHRRSTFRNIDNPHNTVCRARIAAATAVTGDGVIQLSTALFTLATTLVMPFYTMMIMAPKWRMTRKVMESYLPYVVLAGLYVFLLALSWTPETLGLMFASKYWLPELPGIARMFSNTVTVASAWIHLLAVDLFLARHVFLEGLNDNIETRHTLVLCLMLGPIGIFSHFVTKSFTHCWRRAHSETAVEDAAKGLLS